MALPNNLISNFIVLNLPATVKNPAPVWDGKQTMFIPESCARQILVGTEDDIKTLPKAIKDRVTKSDEIALKTKKTNITNTAIRKAGDAYSYLLKVSCGLDSQKRGEPHILGQIKDAWRKFEDTYQDRAKKLSSIIQAIFEDANKIRTNILNHLKPINYAVAAKDLIGIKGGERILIIAEKAGITTDIAKALGKECITAVKEIVISHPNSQALSDRIGDLKLAIANKTIKANIIPIDFQTLLTKGCDSYDHIFICQAMNDNEVDRNLINLWQTRSRNDGKIVHLKGNPLAKNTTTNLWQDASLKNFVTPENISEFYKTCMEKDHKTLAHAEKACDYCSDKRVNNEKPRVAEMLALAS